MRNNNVALGIVLSAVWLAGTLPAWAGEALNKELSEAILAGNKANVEAAIAKGADVNAVVPGYSTNPLNWAIQNTRIDIVTTLIAHGADVNAIDAYGRTPIAFTTQVVGQDPKGSQIIQILKSAQSEHLQKMQAGEAKRLVKQAGATHEGFQKLVSDFKDHPDDEGLRKAIIETAQRLKPSPAVPEEARRHFVKAAALQKAVANVTDYDLVISEYREALRLAPWWGNAYFNMAVALDGAGRPEGEMGALKLYLLTHPADAEARTAQDRLYALEAIQEKTESAASSGQLKKSQAESVLSQFRRIVNGADYERWTACTSSPQRSSCSGVTAQEKEGSNWYGFPAGKACQRYVFHADHVEVCFISDEGNVNCEGALIGTPNGPAIRDMIWETQSNDKSKKQVWAHVTESNGDIEWSGNRPVDQASFDPNTRYFYWWYKRH